MKVLHTSGLFDSLWPGFTLLIPYCTAIQVKVLSNPTEWSHWSNVTMLDVVVVWTVNGEEIRKAWRYYIKRSLEYGKKTKSADNANG